MPPANHIFSSHNMHKPEREREDKFLVTALPGNLDQFHAEVIEQAYMCLGRNPDGHRIRKVSELHTEDGPPRNPPKYFIAMKKDTGGLGEREEFEHEITENDYLVYMNNVESPPIKKVRYRIPHDGHVIELDVYAGNVFPLIIAEVEFTPGEDTSKFSKPEWLGENVTGDKRYDNRTLAKTQHLPNDGRLVYLMRENAA
ncbi:MAG: hypothetical protein ACHQX1_00520, partial [Candidatus Micrarchaeales archaeon]